MAQIPLNNPGPVVPPVGRVIDHVENVELVDGQRRQHRRVTITHMDAQGILRTEEVDQKTPLDCGCAGEDLNDVVVCSGCGAKVCRSRHARQCQICGRLVCTCCAETLMVQEQQVTSCPQCAKEARTPRWVRHFRKAVWGG